MSKSAIVIGSGIAGIASAIRLSQKGYAVSVFEANEYPGGKLTEIRLGDYRFDAGPSVFTMPEYVEELFKLFKFNPSDHFQYKSLDSTGKFFFPDGTQLTAWTDINKVLSEFEEKLGEPRENLEAYFKKSKFLYENLAPVFMHKSLHKVTTWLGSRAIMAYTKLSRFDFNRTMDQANASLFENPKTTQFFNRFATYNGSDPYQAPATFNIIPHLEFGRGIFFPLKGMHHIVDSLYNLAKKVGVKFYFNTPIKKIVVFEGEAKGVNTAMGFHKSDVVVSNMDMTATYKKLLKEQKQPKKLTSQPKSSSALIFYWGIKKEFKQLDLHNIFFSEDYKAEFEHIFKKGDIYSDPTVYLNITSTQKPDDAPEGCQNWFTMINVPNNQGQDWDSMIKKARVNIIKKLSSVLDTDVESLIEEEDILDPRLIEQRTSAVAGALYGNSSNNKYAAFLRHPNHSRRIDSLYFCGGSVHPGGGIPLSLLSAKIATDNIS